MIMWDMHDHTTPEQARKNRMKDCVKVCTLDSTGKYCTGCGRTIEEITERGKKNED
tara:strand:+ start:871 stop:1038 length:168 start_codon:yes stop_codon:yes gene_type:complete